MNELKPSLAGQFGTLQPRRLTDGNLIKTSFVVVRSMHLRELGISTWDNGKSFQALHIISGVDYQRMSRC
jgi:hypothetical protein